MRPNRHHNGETIVSVAIGAVILMVIMATMMHLVSITTAESFKITSRVDNATAAKLVLDNMGRRVRMARNIGDIYGVVKPPEQSATEGVAQFNEDDFVPKVDPDKQGALDAGEICLSSAKFPAPGDPFYGPAANPPAVLPKGWPWGGGPQNPYALSADTLIVQIPAFDSTGWPYAVPNKQHLQALDTYVYKIVPDPDAEKRLKATVPGAQTKLYKMELACFSAQDPANPGNRITNMPEQWNSGVPTTVLTNICGPLDDQTKLPAVFEYVSAGCDAVPANSSTRSFTDPEYEQNLRAFTGVVASLQIMTVDGKRKATVQPLRTEMYLRNNAQTPR